MTKHIISEIILSLAGKLPPDSGFDKRDIWKITDFVTSDLIAQEQSQIPASQIIQSTWVKPLKAVVRWDDLIEEAYLDLPATPLNLPDDGGLREISFRKGALEPIRLLKAGGRALVSKLTSRDTNQTTFYGELIGRRVHFLDMPPEMDGVEMIVKMVCTMDGYDREDIIPLPVMNTELLHNKILDILRRSIPARSNDGNPNT